MEFVFKDPQIYQPYVFSFLDDNWTQIGVKFSQVQAILNDSWVVNLRKPVIPRTGKTMVFRRFENLAVVDPIPLEDNYTGICRRRTEIEALRDAQYQFNKRKYNQIREKQMFNEDELKFIKETAEKDLAVVKQRSESTANEMARLGKNLSDIKIAESRLMNILQAIVDNEKDNKSNPVPYSTMGKFFNRAGCC